MRTALIILFLFLLRVSIASGPFDKLRGRAPLNVHPEGLEPKDSVRADTLLALAKSQIGKNYCYAVSDPEKGFDCSGFVYFVFQSLKINVPRSSKEYKNYGQKISLDSARAGDVIVFTGTNAKKRAPGHVGIIIKNENGIPTFIHSSSGKKKGVIISDFNESPYYKERFIKIVRVAVVY